MKHPIVRFALAAALAMPLPCLRAQEPQHRETLPWAGVPAGRFLKPETVAELARLLPPPPAKDSVDGLADLEAVLMAQAWRTEEQTAWCKLIDTDRIFNNATELGPWFTAENLPRCDALFKQVSADVHALSEAAKRRYGRPRPPLVDAHVKPCVPLPGNTSYPSGHSLGEFVNAGVLAEIFPERAEALFARAHRAAWSRIIAGVHFPTDDVSGRLLAEAVMKELRKSAGFRAEVERCRAEAAPFLLKKAS